MKNKRLLSLLLVLILAVAAIKFLGPEKSVELGQTAAETVLQLIDETEEPTAEAPDEPAAETGEAPVEITDPDVQTDAEPEALVTEDGLYTTKDEVALYIHLYGHLPANFISKKEAQAAGWEGGSLDPYFDGMSIGGDRFGNYEKLLPDAPGRKWTECDINTMHARSRGAERIVFSNDGLIYYTGDHYESFEQLY